MTDDRASDQLSAPASPGRRAVAVLRILVVLALCAVLLWEVVSDGVSRQVVRSRNPQAMAPFADARHPAVATQLATQLFAAGDLDAAIALARAAVNGAPLNARALAILGLALERQGDTGQAATILRRAASLGWRNTPSLVWALQDAARNDDVTRMVEIADALARRQASPTLTRTVFFAALMEPRMRQVFVRQLAARPGWRPIFFADVSERLQPPQFDGMEDMLSALGRTTAPPSAEERLKYVGRLAGIGNYARARNYWAQAFAIPSAERTRNPFDGRFRRAATVAADAPKSPFEWQFDPNLLDDALSFEPDGLRIDTGVGAGGVMASQTLLLPPGYHRIETRLASGSGSTAPAGWTITCLPSNQPLLRTLARDRSDELTGVGFTVPAQGCAAQILRLVSVERITARPTVIAAVTIR